MSLPSNDNQHQPIFNVPPIVLLTAGILIAVFAAYELALDEEGKLQFALWFGFWPIRFWYPDIPGGQVAIVWSLFTHAFLHASWAHVLLNTAWLVIFGTPVARRFGNLGFVAAFLVGAAAGALTFAVFQSGSLQVLIGASGGVAGLTGLALRFMFQPMIVAKDPVTGNFIPLGRRIGPITSLLTETRARAFTLIWFGLNLAIPLMAWIGAGGDMQIAWQAHLGGFVAGALLADVLPKQPFDKLVADQE
ncbi:MAG: rhomboid family intramembrane serine protease [Hyphomicrobiaceae bacterium]|nr:rhomboid family intramembrane serine protease [Hyphomicrobiaceae bacterium]